MSRCAALTSVLVAWLAASAASAQTVDDVLAANPGGCTSAGVEGLSAQLVRSHLCMFPGAVAEIAHPRIVATSSRVHLLGTVETVEALGRAADRVELRVNSAFRTLPEQYLLYHEGGCGLAAEPGTSNHQTGRAVDLQNYAEALSAMTSEGCAHPYPVDDAVHFDCPGPDMRGAGTRVFQRLWNENHPEDPIAEDGTYGQETGTRLGRSPAGGFAMELCQWGAELVVQTFSPAGEAIVMRPGEELAGTFELRNTGTAAWDGSTRLATTGPRDRASAFAGPDWLSPSRAARVEGTVAPGESYPFTFTLRAPDAPGEHREGFGVVQEGVAWFSDPGQLGPPDDQLALRIRVVVEAPPDGGVAADAGPSAGPLAGTCTASPPRNGPVPWWACLVLAGLLRRRRDERGPPRE